MNLDSRSSQQSTQGPAQDSHAPGGSNSQIFRQNQSRNNRTRQDRVPTQPTSPEPGQNRGQNTPPLSQNNLADGQRASQTSRQNQDQNNRASGQNNRTPSWPASQVFRQNQGQNNRIPSRPTAPEPGQDQGRNNSRPPPIPISRGRQHVGIPPRESRPLPPEIRSEHRSRAPPRFQEGYTVDGREIRYVRTGRAVVEDGEGILTLCTAAEAGGTAVIEAALSCRPRIEVNGWSELKSTWHQMEDPHIAWAAPGSWDPYSRRLPEIVCCVVYFQGENRFEKVGSRSNAQLLFGRRVADRMIADSLCEGTQDPDDAMEQLYGVTRRERVSYWNASPHLPQSARGYS
jgi:hypothetical protein